MYDETERDVDVEIKTCKLQTAFWHLYPQDCLPFRFVSDGKKQTMQPPTMYDEFLAKGSF